MNTSLFNDVHQTINIPVQNAEYHERTLYQTMLGVVWTLPRTVAVSEGKYRLDFLFDDKEDKLKLLGFASRRKNAEGEVIVYSFPFYDSSKFDSRGRLLSTTDHSLPSRQQWQHSPAHQRRMIQSVS